MPQRNAVAAQLDVTVRDSDKLAVSLGNGEHDGFDCIHLRNDVTVEHRNIHSERIGRGDKQRVRVRRWYAVTVRERERVDNDVSDGVVFGEPSNHAVCERLPDSTRHGHGVSD